MILLTSALLCLTSAQGAVINGSFENGLSDWNTLGNTWAVTSAQGYLPTSGNSHAIASTDQGAVSAAQYIALAGAVLPESILVQTHAHYRAPIAGSLIYQTFTVAETGRLEFDANSFFDGGLGAALGGVFLLDSQGNRHSGFSVGNPNIDATAASATPYPLEWGWHRGALNIFAPGEYTVVAGILSFDNGSGSTSVSAIAVDNMRFVAGVPEPSSALAIVPLFAIGALLLKRRHS